MITTIRVTNRRRIRECQELLLFHGPGSADGIPEGTPSSAAGLWGGSGTGKSSLVDQIAWIADGIRDTGEAWRPMVPIENNRGWAGETPGETTCMIGGLDAEGRYEYTLSATTETITDEELWYQPHERSGEADAEHRASGIILARTKHAVTTSSGVCEDGTQIRSFERRTPVLAHAAADQTPAMRAVRREILGIRIVRPDGDIRDDLALTARTAESDGPTRSLAGIRRQLVHGLLENIGLHLGALDEQTSRISREVREAIASAGRGAQGAAAIAGHAAHVLIHGGLLVVDPIDSGIHSIWSRQLVETFMQQPHAGRRRGQLLFTTGSSDLLTALPRDQVWLADAVGERNPATIDSLASFKNVDAARLRQDYELGRYGGVPGDNPVTLQ
ncbi:MAG: hypothetical protein OXG35_18090, partial [Acidobacteria bacterium]|nr:hypothetical protein [Acidobacteriota bacterium]